MQKVHARSAGAVQPLHAGERSLDHRESARLVDRNRSKLKSMGFDLRDHLELLKLINALSPAIDRCSPLSTFFAGGLRQQPQPWPPPETSFAEAAERRHDEPRVPDGSLFHAGVALERIDGFMQAWPRAASARF